MHIGDELLTGEVDPYPREIIALVREKGARLDLLEVLGDREEDIIRGLEHAHAVGIDLLVVTGGLGPTLDDVTREALAAHLGAALAVDAGAEEEMAAALSRMHGRAVIMNDVLRRMVRVPSSAKALRNPTGAACGVEAVKDGMLIFLLPGFPEEMVPMFREHVLPRIEGNGEAEIEIRVWRGESSLEPLFEEIAAKHDVRIASLPSMRWREDGNRVVFKGRRAEAEAALDHFQRLLLGEHGEF
ncbi:MAG: competence/damage-inducible protein A [Methanomassiliicoccus sp.]|nr:competence/damage-inducible protein A [Methanomassiliicoccus sp.]